MIDNRIFRRPLSAEELFKEFGPKVEHLISQGKYTEAYKLACKWHIQGFFDWSEILSIIVDLVKELIEEGEYRLAYLLARDWDILDSWNWYLPLPDNPRTEGGEDRERSNGELVSQ